MNDVKTPRLNPNRSSKRGVRPDQAGPSEQLGELEFADWFETPVFEPDDDELREELATNGRGPRQLMARMALAREARKAKRGPQWDEAPTPSRTTRPTPAHARKKTPVQPAAPQPAPAAPAPTAAAAPVPGAATAPVTPVPGAAVTLASREPAKAPAKAAVKTPAPDPAKTEAKLEPKAKVARRAGQPETPVPNDRWSTWATSGPAMTDESLQRDLERDSWRRRVEDLLDRWAAREVAVASRLDRSIERVLSPSEPHSIPSLLSLRRNRSD